MCIKAGGVEEESQPEVQSGGRGRGIGRGRKARARGAGNTLYHNYSVKLNCSGSMYALLKCGLNSSLANQGAFDSTFSGLLLTFFDNSL